MTENQQPWDKYPLISKQLQQVNDQILETIQTPYVELQTALDKMANNGGKYLRPSLLILSAQIVSGKKNVSSQIIKLASSIEILHMATLIHDDIIDDSDKRRGLASIQAQFGKDTAVYTGDLLFTNFFDLLLSAISEHDYLVENAQTMHKIINGELGQMADRFNSEQTFDNYLLNVKGKTAALFCLAAKEGSHFAGGNQQMTQVLGSFAENLGIAFQMIDDILDYSDGKRLNKPILEDVATGVYSLPLLLAFEDPATKVKLVPLLAKKYQMTKDDLKKVQKLVIKSGALEKSKDLARQYSNQALDQLASLPACPANKLLEKMTKRLINRTF